MSLEGYPGRSCMACVARSCSRRSIASMVFVKLKAARLAGPYTSTTKAQRTRNRLTVAFISRPNSRCSSILSEIEFSAPDTAPARRALLLPARSNAPIPCGSNGRIIVSLPYASCYNFRDAQRNLRRIRYHRRQIQDQAFRRQSAQYREQLRFACRWFQDREAILRRHGFSSRHSGFYDPGRRSRRHGPWRSRLQIRRRVPPGPETHQARLPLHGQRRSQHQRQPVLRHRRGRPVAGQQAQHLRRSDRGLRRGGEDLQGSPWRPGSSHQGSQNQFGDDREDVVLGRREDDVLMWGRMESCGGLATRLERRLPGYPPGRPQLDKRPPHTPGTPLNSRSSAAPSIPFTRAIWLWRARPPCAFTSTACSSFRPPTRLTRRASPTRRTPIGCGWRNSPARARRASKSPASKKARRAVTPSIP